MLILIASSRTCNRKMEKIFNMELQYLLFIVITLQGMDNVQGAPSSPGVAPIPAKQLYRQFLLKINQPGCKDPKNFSKCMDGNDALIDYGCRYHIFGPCYCCGQVCSYVEFGEVCTKFCLEGSGSGVGHESIIDLPFNWGDDPPCTHPQENSSTEPTKKSNDLTISQENIDKFLETRKEVEKSTLPTPPSIKPDCLGGNCPKIPVVSSPRIPLRKRPVLDCLGGNCQENKEAAKEKEKEEIKIFYLPLVFESSDRTIISTPRKPPSIKPDCLGGNCPQQVKRKEKKNKESSAKFVFPIEQNSDG